MNPVYRSRPCQISDRSRDPAHPVLIGTLERLGVDARE